MAHGSLGHSGTVHLSFPEPSPRHSSDHHQVTKRHTRVPLTHNREEEISLPSAHSFFLQVKASQLPRGRGSEVAWI